MSTSVAQKRKNVKQEGAFSCRHDGFIRFSGDDTWPRFVPPSASYVLYEPPPPDRATCYSASLIADDLLEAVRVALRDGDDLSARCALHTLRGLAEVVLAKLRGGTLQ
jgi:hypothetical protein